MDCIWRIHVSKKHGVALVFLGPLNFDPNCTDFVEIRDGLDASSPLLKRACASADTPANIFSSGRDMYVRFKSDSYIRRDGSKSGFQATYFAVTVKSGRLITICFDFYCRSIYWPPLFKREENEKNRTRPKMPENLIMTGVANLPFEIQFNSNVWGKNSCSRKLKYKWIVIQRIQIMLKEVYEMLPYALLSVTYNRRKCKVHALERWLAYTRTSRSRVFCLAFLESSLNCAYLRT